MIRKSQQSRIAIWKNVRTQTNTIKDFLMTMLSIMFCKTLKVNTIGKNIYLYREIKDENCILKGKSI